MQTSKNVGMVAIDDSLLRLVESGDITPEAALAKSENRDRFKEHLDGYEEVEVDHV